MLVWLDDVRDFCMKAVALCAMQAAQVDMIDFADHILEMTESAVTIKKLSVA